MMDRYTYGVQGLEHTPAQEADEEQGGKVSATEIIIVLIFIYRCNSRRRIQRLQYMET